MPPSTWGTTWDRAGAADWSSTLAVKPGDTWAKGACRRLGTVLELKVGCTKGQTEWAGMPLDRELQMSLLDVDLVHRLEGPPAEQEPHLQLKLVPVGQCWQTWQWLEGVVAVEVCSVDLS